MVDATKDNRSSEICHNAMSQQPTVFDICNADGSLRCQRIMCTKEQIEDRCFFGGGGLLAPEGVFRLRFETFFSNKCLHWRGSGGFSWAGGKPGQGLPLLPVAAISSPGRANAKVAPPKP